MSRWTHAVCQHCWETRFGGDPHRVVVDTARETCCFCGIETRSGIYVREDPSNLRCRGHHTPNA